MEYLTILLLIVVLPPAAWRISNLLSDTEQVGPAEYISKLRYWAGLRYDEKGSPIEKPGSRIEALLCIFCNSIWIGLFFTILVLMSKTLALLVALPFALSATVIFINKIYNRS